MSMYICDWHKSCNHISTMSMGITNQIANAPQDILKAIESASQKTGVDFDYLVNQAKTESSFKADAKAKTSSATGLYQFIDQTWLATVSKHGSKHGLADVASQIKQDFQGRFYVADDAVKKQILGLRKDPEIASLMAAEFASDNGDYLQAQTGKEASATDLYMAHFLGAGGASKFITAMQETPYRPAAYLLPAAASANKNIFYNSDGSPKNFVEIYNNFEAKFGEVTEVQTAQNETVDATDRSYTRDISFERMYGDKVAEFVRAMPAIDGFKGGSFFEGLYGKNLSALMQKNAAQNSLFLTLTMLDSPK